jgi:hypothetical protein
MYVTTTVASIFGQLVTIPDKDLLFLVKEAKQSQKDVRLHELLIRLVDSVICSESGGGGRAM